MQEEEEIFNLIESERIETMNSMKDEHILFPKHFEV